MTQLNNYENNREEVLVDNHIVSGSRQYKDRVFRLVFKEKPYALSLYNAMNGTNYENPDEIQITTLEQSLYMNMKNDVSFVLHDLMSLYEHQSTYNPNMPLRDLFYVSKQYSALTRNENLYSEELIKIPEPRFVVFYNGTKPCSEYKQLRLSEAFLTMTVTPQLELIVEVYNINEGYNEKLLEHCKPLKDYMVFVTKTRTYQQIMSIEDAVEKSIEECIKEGCLSDFFLKNKAEVIEMSIFEYDEELHMSQERASNFAKGMLEDKILVAKNLMNKLGVTLDQALDLVEVTPDIRSIVTERLMKM